MRGLESVADEWSSKRPCLYVKDDKLTIYRVERSAKVVSSVESVSRGITQSMQVGNIAYLSRMALT